MSKRSMMAVATETVAVQTPSVAKKPKHWSLGLIESMNDPESIVSKSDNVVVIQDKYPKAKIHYLVLPEENINSVYDLNNSHIKLLETFGEVYKELKEQHKDFKLRAGFHAVPSMHRLHMHIISKDMISPCMKTKHHWNSFTTKFFLPYKDILEELKRNGRISRLTHELHKNLLSVPLKCNQCSLKFKNMPQLKKHLLTHST